MAQSRHCVRHAVVTSGSWHVSDARHVSPTWHRAEHVTTARGGECGREHSQPVIFRIFNLILASGSKTVSIPCGGCGAWQGHVFSPAHHARPERHGLTLVQHLHILPTKLIIIITVFLWESADLTVGQGSLRPLAKVSGEAWTEQLSLPWHLSSTVRMASSIRHFSWVTMYNKSPWPQVMMNVTSPPCPVPPPVWPGWWPPGTWC